MRATPETLEGGPVEAIVATLLGVAAVCGAIAAPGPVLGAAAAIYAGAIIGRQAYDQLAERRRRVKPRIRLPAVAEQKAPPRAEQPAPAPAAESPVEPLGGVPPIVQRLEAVVHGTLPEGLSLDADGWLRGPQRRMANAIGCSPAWLNRGLAVAVEGGWLEKMTGPEGTAIRLTPLAARRAA